MAKSNGQFISEDQKMQNAKETLNATYEKFHIKNDQGVITASLIERFYTDTLKAFNANSITINECQRNCMELLTANTSAQSYFGKESQRIKAQATQERLEKEIFPDQNSPFASVNSVNVHYVMTTHGVNKHTRADEIAALVTNLKIAAKDKELPANVVQSHVNKISGVHLKDSFANKLRGQLFEHQSQQFQKIGIDLKLAAN